MENGHAIDATKFGLRPKDVNRLGELLLVPEDSLITISIDNWFRPKFFQSNFWFMWSSTFAFQTWHSVIELRRYFLRFYTLLPKLHDLSCTKFLGKGFYLLMFCRRTKYNQYASMIAPAEHWLREQGVNFHQKTRVTDITFGHVGTPDSDKRAVTSVVWEQDGVAHTTNIGASDLVFVSLGSMVADSRLGNDNAPPELVEHPISGNWKLWETISKDQPDFGCPSNFTTHVMESKWESFTVTLRDEIFTKRIVETTKNALGTGGLMTFKV